MLIGRATLELLQ